MRGGKALSIKLPSIKAQSEPPHLHPVPSTWSWGCMALPVTQTWLWNMQGCLPARPSCLTILPARFPNTQERKMIIPHDNRGIRLISVLKADPTFCIPECAFVSNQFIKFSDCIWVDRCLCWRTGKKLLVWSGLIKCLQVQCRVDRHLSLQLPLSVIINADNYWDVVECGLCFILARARKNRVAGSINVGLYISWAEFTVYLNPHPSKLHNKHVPTSYRA